MNRKAKWIGGAAAAVVLALGGAAVTTDLLTGSADDSLQAEEVALVAGAQQMISEPMVQPVAETPPTPKAEPFIIKRILPISGPIKYGEWHWDDENVPDGPIVMTVDLEARVISVFQGGYEIGAAAVLLGTDEFPTPLGTFPILTKERHNISEKYNNAPMPWTLRLTWDGISVHGGSTVENGYASHGCVAAPDGFMAKLYEVATKGDKVVITRGKRIGMGDPIL